MDMARARYRLSGSISAGAHLSMRAQPALLTWRAGAAQCGNMKPVYTARHPAEAHLIRGMLEAGGIRAEVRGDQLYGAFGELPVLPTVWIFDAAADREAQQLVAEYLRGTPARRHAHERWACAACGEQLEGQFTDCWNCGAARPASGG
jgi:hypothetical protein